MLVCTFIASSRHSSFKNAFYDSINFLILFFIKKTFANFDDKFNNIITEVLNLENAFNKFTFTFSFILSDDINSYQRTEFTK